jgi:hypothetical protein
MRLQLIFFGFSKQGFELGEDLLDRVEMSWRTLFPLWLPSTRTV